LAGSSAGGFANLTIVHGDDDTSFMVTLNNTSGSTVYPGLLTPVAYATHNGEYSLFEMGHYASAGLEALAEDGNPAILADALARAMGVGQSGVQAVAVGADGPGPITDGSAYSFMVADITAHFMAWDAGTEQNQAGAAGPDQAPRQAGPNTGADEGSDNVMLLNDPVWSHLNSASLLRVTLMPVEEMEPEPLMGTMITVTLSGAAEVPGPGDEDGTGVAVLTGDSSLWRRC